MHKVVVLAAMLGLAAASCPNQCSGHGRCGQFDKCTCFYRWTGNDCSQRLCKEGLAWVDGLQANPHAWAECSNKGICDRSTGECVCFAEYEGAACERSSCPNDCSGHGTCEYVHELSDQDDVEWDYFKIQGCRCDGGFEGVDCSQRRCPIGDDPLTTFLSTGKGDRWQITIDYSTSSGYGGTTNYFYLEIVDLYGNTHRSRTFSYSGSLAAGESTALETQLKYLLLDIPAIQSIETAATPSTSLGTYVASTGGTVLDLYFTLMAPSSVTSITVKTDYCVDGCYPYVPRSQDAQVATSQISVPRDAAIEIAECSNRGICDRSTGQCTCFTGHYGLACEYQTVLV